MTTSLGCLTLASGLSGLTSCGTEAGDLSEDLGESRQELLSVANCAPGYQVVQGTAGNDIINVSVTPNAYNVDPTLPICIMGLGGNDTITSGSAGDVIGGGSGNDIINGGGGNDQIFGETGDDQINGNDGNDTINSDHGNDIVSGGNGNDRIVDGRGNNVIHGDAGIDWITTGADNDTIFGEDGNDVLDGGAGSNTLWGGAGNDLLQVPGSTGLNEFHGEDGNDTLQGGAGNDLMEGGNGNDIINGNGGNDTVWGDFINNATATTGTSVDTIHGNEGADNLHGGPGNDILYGDNGNDTLSGDDGDDRLNAGLNGTKTINGGAGNDLEKGSGTGTATGDGNNDVLVSVGTADGGMGTDACSGTSCELAAPASFCTGGGQCAAGQRCATEVNICIYCQSDSECTGGRTCVPTVGCNIKETVCTGGVDDDADGATDCADSDCAQAPACQTGVTALGNSGVWHNCVTTSANQVECWGRSHCSQLGYFVSAETPYSTAPQPMVLPLAGVPTAVRGGSAHSCALLVDGTVQCWGNNTQGQLGGGTITKTCSDPTSGVTTVAGLSGVTQLSAGGNFNCAVVSGGVWCWGENNHGQLGNGSTTNSGTPVAVQGLTATATEVKTGTQNACALLSNGGVQCWGRNNWGQLGDGTTVTPRTTAVTFQGGTVAQIAVAGEFTCARLAGGRVFCAGVNYAGQLGQGTTDALPHPTPVLVSNLTDAADLALGWYHACAIRTGSEGMKCWGRNNFGQVGNGTTSTGITVPVLLGIYNASNVSAGMEYTCVRHFDGTLGCWGNNQYGQLGDGTTTPRARQVAVNSVP